MYRGGGAGTIKYLTANTTMILEIQERIKSCKGGETHRAVTSFRFRPVPARLRWAFAFPFPAFPVEFLDEPLSFRMRVGFNPVE